MKKRVAAFAGSFDPPTRAHLWVLQEAQKIFDDVVVMVASNGAKSRGLLTPEQRVDAWHTMTDAVVVQVDGKKAITQELRERQIPVLVRGIRGPADVEGEQAYYDFVYREAQVRVVHLMVPSELRTISSTAVRSLVGLEDWHGLAIPYLQSGVVLTIEKALDPGTREVYQPKI